MNAFEFDRYVNGVLMAEGVTIERQTNLPDAAREAARIASRGPNGEAPVLVLRSSPGYSILRDDETHAPTVERCAKALVEAGYFYVPTFEESETLDQQIEHGVFAIRALIKEGGENG